jgi:hypothetical protein
MDEMSPMPLSLEAERRIDLLFHPDQRERVRVLLRDECGDNLPLLPKVREKAYYDRFRFAALKLSNGDLERLQNAIRLAKTDWRDLLVAAGFANDIRIHKSWLPDRKW